MLMPLPEKMSWKNPPFVTICLIIVNIAVFFVFQLKDTEAYLKAMDFYQDSGLLQIELKAYAKWAKDHRDYDSIYLDIPEGTEISETAGDFLYSRMSRDDEFQAKLGDGTAVLPDDPQYEKWKELRPKFEDLRSSSVSYSFGFIPAEKKLVTYLTHMFLHGGISHLVGNMIFLWILGIILEMGAGSLTFLFLYLLGGLGAVIGFSFFSQGSMTPLVGASGAISAIMGAFTVIYRMKPVRVFINLGVYIDTLKLPAIIFLPIWLGTEVYSYYAETGSHVAYMAHASGLAVGAVLGLGARRFGFVNLGYIDGEKEPEKDRCSGLLSEAMNHLSRLEIDKAVQVMDRIFEIDPAHGEAARKLFEIEKTRSNIDRLHPAAARYLGILIRSQSDPSIIIDVYETYVSAVGRPKLDPEIYAEIALRMATAGRHEKAVAFVAGISRLATDISPRIANIFFKTAMILKKAGKNEESRQCLEIIICSYPDSQEAMEARGLLGSDRI